MGQNYSVEPSVLGKLFAPDIHYVVPEYQREYNWKKEQVEELYSDLLDDYRQNLEYKSDEYLLGPIVLFKKDQHTFEIIDGQQRLITLTLLFCALRESFKEISIKYSKEESFEHLLDLINTLANPNPKHMTLNNIDDNVALSDICAGKKFKNKTRSTITRNYKILKNETDELCKKYPIDESKNQNRIINNFFNMMHSLKQTISFVRVEVYNEDYSHPIFQSLNSKGDKLNQADLIKSYLLKKTHDTVGIKERWSKIMDDNDDNKNKSITPDALLYESMLSRLTDDDNDVKKRNLYKAVKSKYDDKKSALAYISELEKDAKYIKMLADPELVNDRILRHALRGLKQIRATYFRRPIIAACRQWNISDKKTRDLTDCLVKFFFIYRTICKDDIDKIKRISKKITAQIMNDEKLDSILFTLLYRDTPTGKRQNIDYQKFKNKFLDNVFDLDTNEAKYILFSCERHEQGDEGVPISDKDLHVEHIFPRNPNKEDWPDAESMKEHINRLGNLTLLSGNWNSTLSNHSFADKKSGIKAKDDKKIGYLQSGLKINKKFLIKHDRWTIKEMKIREDELLPLLLKVWDLSKYLSKAQK